MHAEPAAVCKTTSAPRGRYTPSVSPANDDETVTAVVSTLLTLALLLDGGWVNRCVNVSGGILPLLG